MHLDEIRYSVLIFTLKVQILFSVVGGDSYNSVTSRYVAMKFNQISIKAGKNSEYES